MAEELVIILQQWHDTNCGEFDETGKGQARWQAIVKFDPPVKYTRYDADLDEYVRHEQAYCLISAINPFRPWLKDYEPETFMFACDELGKVTDWLEIWAGAGIFDIGRHLRHRTVVDLATLSPKYRSRYLGRGRTWTPTSTTPRSTA